ncbi:hypothetical protein [Mucisphaera calidilacus]|uniref:DUF2892 domain-containing protein n=1 Tax=Mucisphaera calidilacus TaxID=2527982 RepID=A0A518C152_9BACT|nr:hypothetical protein [Mucisphaera calidilacus]QDU72940.1 hypothetical protein Pan265_28160 [Mucisphaera calidilacus]
MQCNIDRSGQVLRITLGVLNLAAGIILGGVVLSGSLTSGWWWLAVTILILAGLFTLYEGLRGWCAVRAMGFRTPI